MSTLRIGTLGTARITPGALLSPAKRLSDVEVVSVAARDPDRARTFAARHGIPRTSQSYETLITDPEIDAVYNPLPNGLHGRWTMAAIDAGKHVLCEKPFAADAAEAARVAERATAAGVVVMEAFNTATIRSPRHACSRSSRAASSARSATSRRRCAFPCGETGGHPATGWTWPAGP